MDKKFFVLVLAVITLFTVAACGPLNRAEKLTYDAWRDSENALDLNGDRKIDYSDYEIYISYQDWRVSDEALDLNDDKKINLEDYEIYLIVDFLPGEYRVENYSFTADLNRLRFDNGLKFNQLGDYLYNVKIYLSKDNVLTFQLSSALAEALDTDYQVIEQAVQSASFNILSKHLVVVETEVAIYNKLVALPFYLEKQETGFSCVYEIEYYDGDEVLTGNISFEIVKVID